jgi:hypothetical protein
MISLRARLIAADLAEHTEGQGQFKTTYLHNNTQAAEKAVDQVAMWLREQAAELRARVLEDLEFAPDALERLADDLQQVGAVELGRHREERAHADLRRTRSRLTKT